MQVNVVIHAFAVLKRPRNGLSKSQLSTPNEQFPSRTRSVGNKMGDERRSTVSHLRPKVEYPSSSQIDIWIGAANGR